MFYVFATRGFSVDFSSCFCLPAVAMQAARYNCLLFVHPYFHSSCFSCLNRSQLQLTFLSHSPRNPKGETDYICTCPEHLVGDGRGMTWLQRLLLHGSLVLWNFLAVRGP